MEKYFKYFGIPLIITLLTVIVGVGTYVAKKDDVSPIRTNDAFDSSIAVYDMADKLTESEEIALQELIDKMSVRACADIAIVTLDDPELGYLSGVTSNVQTQLDEKAPTESPALTGIPTAPTAVKGTNTTQIASTEFVQTAVTGLVPVVVSEDEPVDMPVGTIWMDIQA